MRFAILLAALNCFALWSADVAAQQLRGSVRVAADGAPAAGVIIEAVAVDGGARLAQALTDARGSFVLQLAAGQHVAVRALRIGQRPTLVGEFRLAAGETRQVQVVLSGAMIVLERVRVLGRRVCGFLGEDGATVLTLFDEARKALRATQLVSAQGALTATWELSNQRSTLRGDPIGEPRVREFRSQTSRPFVSLSPDALADEGYVRDVDGETIYYAPDANVLLSERFAEDHCFRAEPWTRDDRDWIGMGFSPARTQRGFVDIEGTLWLDRESAELRLLEYRYANLPRNLRETAAGGEVEFLRLAGGAWIVSRWQIRMPRPTAREDFVERAGIRVETSRAAPVQMMEVAGGKVREISDPRRVVYSASGGASRDASTSTSASAAAAMAELCPRPLADHEGLLWGTLHDSSGARAANGRITVEWRTNVRWLDEARRRWDSRSRIYGADDDGFWLACGLPRAELLEVSAEGISAGAAPVVIPADSIGVQLDFAVPADAPRGRLVGVALDSLRAGQRWAQAQVRVLTGGWQAVTDTAGRFVLDGLPEGRHELVALDDELRAIGVALRPIAVDVRGGETASVVVSSPSAEALFAHLCPGELAAGSGLLMGELRDSTDATVAGLPVSASWQRLQVTGNRQDVEDRKIAGVTDARGRFVLCGVPMEGAIERRGDVTVYSSGELVLRVGAGADSARGDGVGVRLAGAAVQRRDLIVGERRGVGAARTDSMAQALASRVAAARSAEDRASHGPEAWRAEFDARRRSYSFGAFIDDEMVKRQPVLQQAFVARRIPRARLRQDASGAVKIGFEVDFDALRSDEAAESTGGNAVCFPRWYVDGQDYGIVAAVEEAAWLQRAARVEAYRVTMAPPQFSDFAGCGVILVWTR